MSEYLFEHFRRSRREYQKLLAFWNDTIWNTIPEFAREGWITPWFSQRHPDLQDGNPIFTAWSPDIRRGLQIIALPPSEAKGRNLGFWVDWFGGDASDPTAIRKLVMQCALADSGVDPVREMIAEWLVTGTVNYATETVEVNSVIAAQGAVAMVPRRNAA